MEKGLKFTPTPTKPNTDEINQDLFEFTRRIQLAEFFHDKENDDDSLVRAKSKWTPALGRSVALDAFVKNVNNISLNDLPPKPRNNITKNQRQAISSLANNKDIVIKEADKGGAVVLMNTSHYKKMAEDILKDDSYYETLETDPQKMDRIHYNRLLDKHAKCLREKEYKYLTEFESKPSQFYGLPKVHKSNAIKLECTQTKNYIVEMDEVDDLKLRPIIAGPICQTSRLSNLIDILLKPLVKHVPSFLKDTTDFLRHLPKTIPEHTILASFDVESLYSNICHTLGLEAVKYWLDNFNHEIPGRFTTKFILDSLEFIIKHNTFLFNNIFYLQTKGTAMGTKVAPTYATLTIGYLEQKLYKEIEKEFGVEFGEQFRLAWKRFLDDCFILWTKSISELATLHTILNSLHVDINFTLDSSEIELPFLDCLVIKRGTILETDIFYKPTDSKAYLLFDSCHPKHIKVSIPFSLSRRLKMIVSNTETFEKRAIELETYLCKQKYPITLIKAGIEKARALDRQELLTETDKRNDEEIIPYVSTFNPRNPEIYSQLHHDINILKRDPYMKTVLDQFTFIKSKRQPPNLKHLLTRAKFCQEEHTPKITCCGRTNCGLCMYLIEGEQFTTKSGHTLTVKFDMSCNVKNVVYIIICNGCHEEYVGETNDLRKRITVHRQHIRDPRVRILRVSSHIDQCTTTEPKFRVFPAFKMKTDCTASRRLKEKQLIQLLKPKLN